MCTERKVLFMKELWTHTQLLLTAIGGGLGYFLGGFDGLIFALILFVVMDYITGVMCAISDKKLSSSIGFKGICRKILIFTLGGLPISLICTSFKPGQPFGRPVSFSISQTKAFRCLKMPLIWVCPFRENSRMF